MSRFASKGAGTVALAALAAATSTPLVKLASGLPPLVVASGRTGGAALILFAATAPATTRTLRALPRAVKMKLAIAGALLGAHFALFVAGVMKTSLGAAVALISLEPVAILVLAVLFLRSRPSALAIAGVLAATLGALAVGLQESRGAHTVTGDLLVLVSVIVYATYLAVTRTLREEVPLVPYATAVFGIASLVTLPFLPFADALGAAATEPLASPAIAWGAVLALAAIPTALGHTLIARAARTSTPALVALVSPGETLGSMILGAAFLSASPSLREIVGAVMILGGATLTTWAEKTSA